MSARAGLLAAVMVVLTADFADADKVKPPAAIDVKPALDKLEVYRDELGNFYVVPKRDAFKESDDADKWLFYGDAKALYQQRVIGAYRDDKARSWTVWAPRAKGLNGGEIDLRDTGNRVSCRRDDKDAIRKLTQLPGDEAKTFLTKAKLYGVLWQRQAHLLARDDDGIYYYVDELREEYGGNGYRVFVGMKGAMKELAMTNIVRDSSGEIYATKTGQLKIIAGAKEGTTFWVKGGKKSELTPVDILSDRYLVYRELGIYGQLGAYCDDL